MATDKRHDASTTTQLLQSLHAGDQQAASELLVRHRDRLTRMVRARMDRRLSGRVDASDIVQEAMLDASAKLANYRPDDSVAFYPWIRQIAWEHLVRAHRHHLHAKKRSVAREEVLRMEMSEEPHRMLAERLVSHGASPSAQLTQEELGRAVRRCLECLAEKDRELILLRYVEQLSNVEIATVLGVTEAAAKMRHLRCIRRLRQLLDTSAEG